MILPTKHLKSGRSLLAIGAEILANVDEAKTMSRVWSEFSASRNRENGRVPVSYDWFVLSLDLLFILGAVEYKNGRLVVSTK